MTGHHVVLTELTNAALTTLRTQHVLNSATGILHFQSERVDAPFPIANEGGSVSQESLNRQFLQGYAIS